MKSPIASLRVVRFGAFEADLQAGELRKNGLKVKLQDQPFQILAVLLERAGGLVTREELQQKLWPADTFTDFDHGLNNAINRLREALCDSVEKPRYVETLPRRGYRFIARVETTAAYGRRNDSPPAQERHNSTDQTAQLSETAHAEVPLPQPKGNDVTVALRKGTAEMVSQPTTSRSLRAGLMLAVLAAGTLGWFVSRRKRLESDQSPAQHIRSLVVLPLENVSGHKDEEYFADGMTDELITSLAKLPSLRVISRTSAMRYKGTTKPPGEIARELNVQAIVEGEVLHSGDGVRITAQLIEATTDRPMWAETYPGDLKDVLALQDEVAEAIASEIQLKLTPEEHARFASAHPVSPEAHEAYLKGRYFFNKRTDEGMEKSVEYLRRAVDIDARYALAYAGLADSYVTMAGYGLLRPKEAFPEAKEAATKSLEIDDTLAEAHTALGFAETCFDWDWAAAEREFRRAIELNPNYATAHHWYAQHLMNIGQAEHAIAELKRARDLDPLSLIVNTTLGRAYRDGRHYDEAIQQCQKTLYLDANFAPAHWCLGLGYVGKERYAEAIKEFHKAKALGEGPIALWPLGYTYAVSGRKAEARKIVRELQQRSYEGYASPYFIAAVYAGLGEKDRAFEWLDRAYDERENMWLDLDPFLDNLRSDRRFQELRRRVGLPP